MTEARKHHYVPQMYLSGFANAKGQLWANDASIPKTFAVGPANIAAERDWNEIAIDGVPKDALEKELGKFEGIIAPAVKRVRQTASFGKDGEDREDIINLVTLLAVRIREFAKVYSGSKRIYCARCSLRRSRIRSVGTPLSSR